MLRPHAKQGIWGSPSADLPRLANCFSLLSKLFLLLWVQKTGRVGLCKRNRRSQPAEATTVGIPATLISGVS